MNTPYPRKVGGAHLVQQLFGGRADRRIRPVVAMSFTYAVFSTFWVYVGVFAVKGLGAAAKDVGLLFLLSAPPAAVANYASGAVSDRLGRRGLIVGSFAASAANMTVLWLVGQRVAVAFALIVVQGVVGAPAYSLDRVLVADFVPEPEGREDAYATVRVANNLGILVGPPLAALLIDVGGWSAFLLGLAAAMLLMGLPFLTLIAASNVAFIAAVIIVFVVGEMLWIPTSQALAAELAPPTLRGTYFGALAAMTGPAWTLVPLIALQLRTAVGVAAVWLFFAIAAVVGATVGVAAARAAQVRAKRLSG